MAGPAVAQFLVQQDYDTFSALVRRFNHDVLSPASNLAIAAEVAIKLLQKRADLIVYDPIFAEDAVPLFETMLQMGLDLPRATRQFVWGQNPDDQAECEALNRARWQPYSVAMWDVFAARYVDFVKAELRAIERQIRAIEDWRDSGVIAHTDMADNFVDTVNSLRQTLERVHDLLDPNIMEPWAADALHQSAAAPAPDANP